MYRHIYKCSFNTVNLLALKFLFSNCALHKLANSFQSLGHLFFTNPPWFKQNSISCTFFRLVSAVSDISSVSGKWKLDVLVFQLRELAPLAETPLPHWRPYSMLFSLLNLAFQFLNQNWMFLSSSLGNLLLKHDDNVMLSDDENEKTLLQICAFSN